MYLLFYPGLWPTPNLQSTLPVSHAQAGSDGSTGYGLSCRRFWTNAVSHHIYGVQPLQHQSSPTRKHILVQQSKVKKITDRFSRAKYTTNAKVPSLKARLLRSILQLVCICCLLRAGLLAGRGVPLRAGVGEDRETYHLFINSCTRAWL